MKKLAVVLIFVVFAGAVYYFGLYTYFLKSEIMEDLPSSGSAALTPKILASGSFGEVDLFHKGSGQAKIIDLEGKKILRLEILMLQAGRIFMFIFQILNNRLAISKILASMLTSEF